MTNAPTKTRFKLLAVGVGGQGVITATRLIGEAAMAAGLEVVAGQLHGMSQRGGNVLSTVLIGPGQSSFIADGQADVVLGLEPLEVLRALPKMSERTKVLVNLGRVAPFVLAAQGKPYPDLGPILQKIRAAAPQTYEIDGAAALGQGLSNQSLNMFMLGALAALDVLPFAEQWLILALEKRSPARFLQTNRRAYGLGKESVHK